MSLLLSEKEIEQIYEDMIDTMINNCINPDAKDYSPLRYYGGKYYIADDIVSLFSKHVCYVEPFFGAGHVFFKKPPSKVEIINDVDNNLISFYKVLQDYNGYKSFLRLMVTTPISRSIHSEFRQKLLNNQFNNDVERAFAFFYIAISSFNGKVGGSFSYSSCRNLAQQHYNKVRKIIFAHQRLTNAVIENLDAIEVIKRYDSKETLFYLDPPYVHETRVSKNDYLYEMKDEKHKELIETVLSSKGMFVVSNYDNNIYQKLEDYGYKKITIDVSCYSSYRANERFNHTKPLRQEVIWYNTKRAQMPLTLF